MKTALIQLNAQADKDRNIRRAEALVKKAIVSGAEFILLPEIFHFRGTTTTETLQKVSENIPGPSLAPFIALAKKHSVYILAGSIYERVKNTKKVFNTSVLIDNKGRLCAKYRKINLFKARLGAKKIDESEKFLAGNSLSVVKVKGFTVGLSICYDLRFPELFQKYFTRGVDVICIPSAFTRKTGQAHWEVLLRARAVENLCYVLAPNQTGVSNNGIPCYGHSMAVGPWGNVISRASADKEEIIFADLKLSEIQKHRKTLPGLKRGS